MPLHRAATFCIASLAFACTRSAEPSADHAPPSRVDTSVVDRESTRQKLERVGAVPERSPSEPEFTTIGRAYGALRGLGKAGFDDFVACVDDARPVWPSFQEQTAEPTTLGDVCLSFITEQVEALYLKKEGLGIVTKKNVREWLSHRREASLADLQIETLSAYRERLKLRAATAKVEVKRHLEGTVLPDLTRRIENAKRERSAGRPLTVDTVPR